MKINIHPLSAFTDNYIWMIETEHELICIDPGQSQPVIDYCHQRGKTLRAVLITHHHYDHIDGLSTLKKLKPNIEVYAPDDKRIAQTTTTLNDGDQFSLLNIAFQVLFIPGHTSSHIAFYAPDLQALFCGDTLFSAGCGRVFDGTMSELYHSLQRISQLPLNTKIYCAHEYTLANLKFAHQIEPDNQAIIDYMHQLQKQEDPLSLPSTLENELKINPFLRLEQPDIVRTIQQSTPEERFIVLRKMKDSF